MGWGFLFFLGMGELGIFFVLGQYIIGGGVILQTYIYNYKE